MSYEVHMLTGGQWKVGLLFDDQYLAESEALRIMESSWKPQSVRVVQQALDVRTNLIQGLTVFRRTRGEEDMRVGSRPMPHRETAGGPDSPPQPAVIQTPPRAVQPPSAGRRIHWLWLLVIFSLLGLGAVAAEIGLRVLWNAV